MRPKFVTRLVAELAVLLVAACLAFAWLVHDGPRPQTASGAPSGDGAALFARHCAECHAREDLTSVLARASDLDAAADEMRNFLRDHADASDEQDRAIVAYLRPAPAGGPARR